MATLSKAAREKVLFRLAREAEKTATLSGRAAIMARDADTAEMLDTYSRDETRQSKVYYAKAVRIFS